MRIGVIGTGRIGRIHANTLSRHRDVGSLILTDADVSRAQELAHRLGYFDQAAFNHAFEKLTGAAPKAFLTRQEG